MPRISHMDGRHAHRRARKEQMQWLAMPLVRLLFLVSAAEVMTALFNLPFTWVLCSLFLALLANCMVSGLAEGGDSADELAQGPTLTHEAECLLRFLLVMGSVLTTLTIILLLLLR